MKLSLRQTHTTQSTCEEGQSQHQEPKLHRQKPDSSSGIAGPKHDRCHLQGFQPCHL